MAFQFKPAVRTQVYLKILIKGPTNGGKTFGALHIADGLAPGKVALADSEHDRSLFYSDVVPFQHGRLENFHPKSYIEVINAAVSAGFEVLVIDSLSHCWMNVLERKDAYDKANPRTNQWTNWALFGEEWDDLLRTILEAPIHIICTARSKMAHEQVEQNGKKQVVKLGMAPQLRDNTEYEFALCFDVETTTDNRHPAQVSKDNTGLFSEPGKIWNLTDGTVPALLRQWMSTAKEVERPTPETQKAIDDALLALPEDKQARARKRVAERKQRGLPEDEAQVLLQQLVAMAPAASNATSTATSTAASTTASTTAAPSEPAASPAQSTRSARTSRAARASAPPDDEPPAASEAPTDSPPEPTPAADAEPQASDETPSENTPEVSLDEAMSMKIKTTNGNVILGELSVENLRRVEANARRTNKLLIAAACARAIAYLERPADEDDDAVFAAAAAQAAAEDDGA
jgi:hypothetical protein